MHQRTTDTYDYNFPADAFFDLCILVLCLSEYVGMTFQYPVEPEPRRVRGPLALGLLLSAGMHHDIVTESALVQKLLAQTLRHGTASIHLPILRQGHGAGFEDHDDRRPPGVRGAELLQLH